MSKIVFVHPGLESQYITYTDKNKYHGYFGRRYKIQEER